MRNRNLIKASLYGKKRVAPGWIRAGWLIVLLPMVAGCVKAKFDPRPENGKVTLVFDWGDNTPASKMQVWLYDSDGNKKDAHENAGSSDLTLTLPVGRYKILAANCDSPECEFRNMERYETAGIFLAGIVRSSCTQVMQPSSVYGTRMEFEVAGSDSTGYRLSPESYVKSLSLDLDFKGNTGMIKTCSAVLEGVSTGVDLSGGCILHGGNGSHEISLSQDGSAYKGNVNLFGKDERNTGAIVLEIEYKDGSQQLLRLDIDDRLVEINNAGTLSITVELSMQQAGLAAQVVGWDVVPGGDMDTERKQIR